MNGKLYGVIPTQTPTGVTDRFGIDIGSDVGQGFTLDQAWDTCCELGHFNAALDLGASLRQGLAVLPGDEGGEILEVSFHLVAEAEHDSRTIHDRRIAPSGEGLGSGLHGLIRLVCGAHRGLCDHFTGRWIEDITGSRALTCLPGTPD